MFFTLFLLLTYSPVTTPKPIGPTSCKSSPVAGILGRGFWAVTGAVAFGLVFSLEPEGLTLLLALSELVESEAGLFVVLLLSTTVGAGDVLDSLLNLALCELPYTTIITIIITKSTSAKIIFNDLYLPILILQILNILHLYQLQMQINYLHTWT